MIRQRQSGLVNNVVEKKLIDGKRMLDKPLQEVSNGKAKSERPYPGRTKNVKYR